MSKSHEVAESGPRDARGALFAAPLIGVAASASASVDGTGVVINEAYLNGGSAGAPYTQQVRRALQPERRRQSRSTAGRCSTAARRRGRRDHGVAAALRHHRRRRLLPGPGSQQRRQRRRPADARRHLGHALSPPGPARHALPRRHRPTALTAPARSLVGDPAIVDLLGYGTSNTFERRVAVDGRQRRHRRRSRAPTCGRHRQQLRRLRLAHAPTPQNSAGDTPDEPDGADRPTEPDGPGRARVRRHDRRDPGHRHRHARWPARPSRPRASSPRLPDRRLQRLLHPDRRAPAAASTSRRTPRPTASSSTRRPPSASVAVGDYVAGDRRGQRVPRTDRADVATAAGLTVLDTAAATPLARRGRRYPGDAAQREALEGMLLAPDRRLHGHRQLPHQPVRRDRARRRRRRRCVTPTEIASPGTAEYTAAVADNAATAVTLDDGASINFLDGGEQGHPAAVSDRRPGPVTGRRGRRRSPRRSSSTTATAPGSSSPPQQLTGRRRPCSRRRSRTRAPRRPPTSAATSSSPRFNVLNYFTTTGDELARLHATTPTAPATRSRSNTGAADGPRCRERREPRSVSRPRSSRRSTLSMPTSSRSRRSRTPSSSAPTATTRSPTLVDALNAAAGADTWAFVPSPDASSSRAATRTSSAPPSSTSRPPSSRSVTRASSSTRRRSPTPVSRSRRRSSPPARTMPTPFLAIVNHFKSKGSGTGATPTRATARAPPTPPASPGQGPRDVRRPVSQTDARHDEVFLVGDFNSYTKEDPMRRAPRRRLHRPGTPRPASTRYSFGGAVGSLDHIFASPAADAEVTGADIWNINSVESIALEYSRYNYNATELLRRRTCYRSSDHDPVVVGLDADAAASGRPQPARTSTTSTVASTPTR